MKVQQFNKIMVIQWRRDEKNEGNLVRFDIGDQKIAPQELYNVIANVLKAIKEEYLD